MRAMFRWPWRVYMYIGGAESKIVARLYSGETQESRLLGVEMSSFPAMVGVKVSVRLGIGGRHYAAFNSFLEMVHMQGRLIGSLLYWLLMSR